MTVKKWVAFLARPFLSSGIPSGYITLNLDYHCYPYNTVLGIHLIKLTGIGIKKESGCTESALPSAL